MNNEKELPRVVVQKLGRHMEDLRCGPNPVGSAKAFYFAYEDVQKETGSESEADRIYLGAWMKKYKENKNGVDEAVRAIHAYAAEGSDSTGTVDKLVALLERIGVTKKNKKGENVVALSAKLSG